MDERPAARTAEYDEEHFASQPGTRLFIPRISVEHRDEEYDAVGFDILRDMQTRHFWYRGRHRFVSWAAERQLRNDSLISTNLSAIDLGGGCGGWIRYLVNHSRLEFGELALADSSLDALRLAGEFIGDSIDRFQVDLLRLPWNHRWDVAFLLDVLEHIPKDQDALTHIRRILRPDGLLFVTTPALDCFWTYNDDLAYHVRRYTKRDFAELAESAGFELCCCRYFMFFLSPLLYLSRSSRLNVRKVPLSQLREIQKRAHRVPIAPINGVLTAVFGAETPLGIWLPFPWGTSILGVFRKK